MDLQVIASAWDIPAPTAFRPIDVGYMNATYFLDTPDRTYIFRIYKNVELRRIRHEHALTAYLADAGLPFAVPAPIPARSGETLVSAGEHFASLLPVIPGGHPDLDNPAEAAIAGEAVGDLAAFLSRIPRSFQTEHIPTYGDLADVHPAVPDPVAAAAKLPLEPSWQHRLASLWADMLEHAPPLYRSLPRQMIHGDPTFGNIMLQDGRPSGFIDFEFSCWDLRCLDFAIWLGGGPWGLSQRQGDWDMLEVHTRAYFRRHRLTGPEIDALPQLLRLRRATIVARYAGRWLEGVDPESTLQMMTGWLFRADDWCTARGAELVDRVHAWTGI